MIELELTWLNANGSCGARHGKGIAEVRGGVPGDRVQAEVTDKRGRNVRARVSAIVEPASARRPPPCPHDAVCGGCDLAALRPDAQRQAKAGMVQHALRLDALPEIVASPRPTGHRARVKLGLDGTRVGYHRSRSHDLVDIDVCGIARPEVQDALGRLRAHLDTHGPLPFSEVEIRSDGERAVFAFAGSRKQMSDELHQLGDVAVGGKSVSGDATLHLDVLGLSLRASPPSFFQVNLEGNALLAAFVRDTVLATSPAHVLDLYAGIGNLDLPLAVEGIGITAVELEGAAIRDLAHTAAALGVTDKVTVRTGAAERYDPTEGFFDVLVLDPPRAGAPGVLKKAAVLRPHTVVYVACHVGSLARDSKELLRAGYHLEQVRCFDLFPDTHHVETVAVFKR